MKKILSSQFSALSSTSGQVLIVVLIFLSVILITTLSIFSLVSFFTRNATVGLFSEQALHLAEAGVDRAIYELNTQGSAYTGETDTPVGNGTLTVTIIDVSLNVKEITSTGFIPNSQKPQAKKTVKIRVAIGTENISFHYAVQVGTGGVFMENSARINGTVYSNKPGTNSIEGQNSALIDGDAYAVGTISSPDPTVTGTKYPNSQLSEMPTVDYNFWKGKAADGGVTTCTGGNCTYSSGTTNIGPQKFVGNLVVQNTAQLVMQGPVWVTGGVTVQNSAKIKLAESFGSSGTVLILDGKLVTQNSAQFVPTSSNPKGYILVTTTSTADDAVKIENSGVNAIFYALEGGAVLENTAQVIALVAKRLQMKNSATLTYDLGLASAQFSSGPGGSWQIASGTYKIE